MEGAVEGGLGVDGSVEEDVEGERKLEGYWVSLHARDYMEL